VNNGDQIGYLNCNEPSEAEDYPGVCWKQYSVNASKGATAQNIPGGEEPDCVHAFCLVLQRKADSNRWSDPKK
jgi:hypothetical protein